MGTIVPASLAVSRLSFAVATFGGFLFVSSSVSEASPVGTSAALNFGAEQPGRNGNGAVNGAAGVLNTVNWNNFSGPSGSSAVSLDVNGLPVASGASVTWSSNNTWSSTGLGEENNTATGESGDLMSGYLDSLGVGEQGPLVSVSGLSSVSAFSIGYDVYVYVQGGVNGRGGNYTLGSKMLFHAPTAPFTGVFVEDTTPDSPSGPEGTAAATISYFAM